MALADEVTARYSTQALAELTNPETPTATTINTTFLAYAVTDVEAEFGVSAGLTYDNSVASHVAVAVEGVIARLKVLSRTGAVGGDASSAWDTWIETRLSALAKATSRKRITPVTTSQLTPSDEVGASDRVRPDFDRVKQRDFIPDLLVGEDDADNQ